MLLLRRTQAPLSAATDPCGSCASTQRRLGSRLRDQNDLNPEHQVVHLSLDGSVILLNEDAVEVFDLAHFNAGLVVSIVASDCRRIGTALVDRDLFRCTVTSHRLAQKTKRGFAIPVWRSIRSLLWRQPCRPPCIQCTSRRRFDLHIGLVQSPTGSDRTLARAEPRLQQRNVFEHPAIERGMVNLHAVRSSIISSSCRVADRIGHAPADAPQDHVPLEMATLELNHHPPPYRTRCRRSYTAAVSGEDLRQNPFSSRGKTPGLRRSLAGAYVIRVRCDTTNGWRAAGFGRRRPANGSGDRSTGNMPGGVHPDAWPQSRS